MPESLRLHARWLVALSSACASVAGCKSLPLDEPAVMPGAAGAGGSTDDEPEPRRVPVLTGVRIVSDPDAENFQRATASVDFGAEPVQRATLRVTLASPCFPFSNWEDLGIPAGQNWPEPCDAFDRTVSVTLDDAADLEVDPPRLELLRGVTPFGGPLELETDITDVVNGLPGEHRFALRIDTWSDADGLVSGSKGEWLASAEVALYPGAPPRHVLSVVPLFFESRQDEDAAPISFEVPEGSSSGRVEYHATGHGSALDLSCNGPAEEFCQRTHTLTLDGVPLPDVTPWRDDCADLCTLTKNDSGFGPRSYCAENPCGDPRSVRAPRANWCPGSVSTPFQFRSTRLSDPGTHELGLRIPGLARGGLWTVSATYFAFE